MNKKILNNFSWLSIEIIIRVLLSFVVTTFLIRKGGPKFFGEIEYALAFLGFLEIGSQLMNSEILKKEIINNKESAKDLLIKLLKIFSVYYLIVFVGLNLILWADVLVIVEGRKKWILSILSIGLLFGSDRLIMNYFDAVYKSKINVLTGTIGMVSFNIFRFLAILVNPISMWIAVCYVYKKVFLFIVMMYYLLQSGLIKSNEKYQYSVVDKILKPSLPLLLVGAMSVIFSRFDILILSYLIDDIAVGQYSAANKIIQPTLMITGLLSRGFFPQLVKYKKDKRGKLVTFIFGISFYISLAIAICVWFLSDYIVMNLFGDSYLPSIQALKILAIGNVFLFWSVIIKDYEVVTNNTSHTLWRFIWPIVVNILLNFILIPTYGINGAAIATLISYFILGFGYGVFTKFGRSVIKLQLMSLISLDYRNINISSK